MSTRLIEPYSQIFLVVNQIYLVQPIAIVCWKASANSSANVNASGSFNPGDALKYIWFKSILFLLTETIGPIYCHLNVDWTIDSYWQLSNCQDWPPNYLIAIWSGISRRVHGAYYVCTHGVTLWTIYCRLRCARGMSEINCVMNDSIKHIQISQPVVKNKVIFMVVWSKVIFFFVSHMRCPLPCEQLSTYAPLVFCMLIHKAVMLCMAISEW